MANAMKGQARFEAADKAYTLTLSFNELVELEDEWGLSLDKDFGERISQKLQEKSRNVRTLFRIMLSNQHPGLTDRDVGDIMSEIGLEECADLIKQTVSNAFPKADEARPQGAGQRKAKASPGK